MTHQENMVSVLLYLVLIYAGTTDGYMDNKCPCHFDEIQHIANCSYLHLTSVPECIPNDTIVLLLSGNDINSLDTGIFERFNNMKMLFLDYNTLDHLQEGVFSNLSHLKTLSLAHNKLMFNDSYTDNIFEPLINLKRLNLEGNFGSIGILTPIDFPYPDKALSVLSKLEYLHLDGLPNKPLGKGFSKLVKLNTLKMDGIITAFSLDHITTETFKHLQLLPVTDIELSTFTLQSILPNTFKGFTKLRNLAMSIMYSDCDGITNVTIGLNTTDIKMLHLSYWLCDKLIINEDTFKGIFNTTLEVLNISGNGIKQVDTLYLYGLPRTLKYISFKGNIIHNIDFLCLPWYTHSALEVLDTSFQNNLLSSNSDKKMLTYMPHLHPDQHPESERYINGTDKVTLPKLNTTDIFYDYLTCQLPHKLKVIYTNNTYIVPFRLGLPIRFTPNSLQHFDLSNCKLTMFPGPWSGLHDLQFLNFSGNYFTMIKPNAFSDMKKLTILDLGDNSIKYIPRNIFQSQQNLQMLSLANNALSSINFTLNYTISLQFLNISKNILTSLSEQNTAELDQIAVTSNLTVDMTGNHLLCNCENIEFVKWFSKTNVQLFNKQHLFCKFVNGTMLKTLRMDDINGELTIICSKWLVLISSTVAILLLILSLIAALYYKWWTLQYWYYIGRKKVNPYHALDGEIVQFNYDVYISYDPSYIIFPDQSLDDFVKTTVLPRFKDRGLNAEIREGLHSGRGMCDVISVALKGSRKVIAFVSKDYCSDYWNTFEFNMAVHEGMYTKRAVVIPVKCGDNLENTLNPEIDLFLNSNNYLTFNNKKLDKLLEDLEDNIRRQYL